MSYRTLTALLIGCVLYLSVQSIFTQRHIRKADSHKIEATTACIKNLTYPRNLLPQCLDDYAEMRGWK